MFTLSSSTTSSSPGLSTGSLRVKHADVEVVGRDQPRSSNSKAWAKASTPAKINGAVRQDQEFANAGLRHCVVQSLSPHDDLTVRLLAERVIPAIRP